MSDTVDFRLAALFRQSGISACLGVLVAGLLVTAGWVLDYEYLKSPLSFGGKIHSSVAITFIFSALALAGMSFGRINALAYRIGQVLALLVVAGGALTLYENMSGLDLGLNHIWWQAHEDAPGITFPGPMAPGVSLCFVLTGISSLLFGLKWRQGIYPAQILAVAAALLALIAVLGHTCGVAYLCTLAGCIKVPLAAALMFLLLCYAGLFLGIDHGLVQVFAKASKAGTLVRRFSLLLACLPVLLWIKNEGEKAGLYEPAFGWAVFSLCSLALMISIIAWTVKTLDSMDSAFVVASTGTAGTEPPAATSPASAAKTSRHVCPQCAREFPYDVTECPDDGAELIRAVDDPFIGSHFAGKYDIKKLLGWGATSSVYLAEHCDLKKAVAIKLMHAHKLSNMRMIKRFKHEAQTISLLAHQNLVAVHDFGFTEAGEPYLVMDFLEGPDLDDLLQEALDARLPMDIDRALTICLQVCDGLSHAHQREVIHRDMKPSNIIVVKGRDGKEQVKIVDFGFAKALSLEESMKLTKTGEVFGSPAFMSPEQCMGKVADARSDIYAVGCILFECLTGVQAFDGENPFEILRKHVFEEPPPFPDDAHVPAALQREVLKALHRDPEQRHQTAAELKEGLLQARRETRELPVQ